MKQMTPSEKRLAFLVGGVAFLLLNLFLVSYIVKQQQLLRAQLAARNAEWTSMQELVSERGLWKKRDEWLGKKQPRLANESSAGVRLLDQVHEIAKSNDVLIENPGFGTAENTPFYRSVSVNIESKSSWAALIAFLRTLQQPEQFMVLENANVQIDPTNPAQIHGKFKIAKWYAP